MVEGRPAFKRVLAADPRSLARHGVRLTATRKILAYLAFPPVVVAALLAGACVLSKSKTGRWSDLAATDNFKALACVVSIVAAGLSYSRIRRLVDAPAASLGRERSRFQLKGFRVVRRFRHYGVDWPLALPSRVYRRETNPSAAPSSALKVMLPPLCPKCGAQLEELQTGLSDFRWRCPVGCVAERSPKSFVDAVEEVLRICGAT